MGESLAAEWAELARLGATPPSPRALFAADPQRFARFSRQADGLLLDFSKTAISDQVLTALLALARAADVAGQRDAMARGDMVNATEGRAEIGRASCRERVSSPV